jgi:hypothetical protein
MSPQHTVSIVADREPERYRTLRSHSVQLMSTLDVTIKLESAFRCRNTNKDPVSCETPHQPSELFAHCHSKERHTSQMVILGSMAVSVTVQRRR